MRDLTPKQALLIWCLLGFHGRAPQKDVVPKVDRADREALVRLGLISSLKSGRSFLLEVEDKGWNWAGQHLDSELPANLQVLRNWLARVREHLERTGATLADFVGPPPDAPPQPEPAKKSNAPGKPKGKRQRLKKPTRLSNAQLRGRIEEAYLAVTGGRKAEGALLSKVRAQLTELDRATVDEGLLRILQGDKKARLGQISDPKALSSEDREAAFSPGGEPFHLLWIQS